MMEMKIKIEVPDLAAAICKLAAAITPPDPNTLTPDEPRGIPAAPQQPVAPTAPQQPVSAPVAAPVPTAPVNPTPAAPAPQMPPVEGMAYPQAAVPTAPAPTNTPAPAPAGVPVSAPTFTLDQISRAGAALVDAGKMEALLGLLAKFGVAAVTQLNPGQYGAFATELRALGAQI